MGALRNAITFGVGMMPLLAVACLNDIDTIRQTEQKFPGVIDVIVGRFDRNPDLYYQMRIDREIPLVRAKPAELQFYDDIAVAYDRLGNDPAAMEWMAKKKQQLDMLGGAAPSYHLYSYHANLGTFLIHDFVKSGAKKSQIGQAVEASDHINQAIEINPNAHFGREQVQLDAINWIIEVVETGLATQLNRSGYPLGKDDKNLKGLQGLVVLGAAWESVDIFLAIAESPWLATKGRKVQQLASLRVNELTQEGKKSLASRNGLTINDGSGQVHSPIYSEYLELRKNADEYNRNRRQFMLGRLRAGKHPDTDSGFWAGYRETPRRVAPWTLYEPWHALGYLGQFLVILGTLGGVLLGSLMWVRGRIELRKTFKQQRP